MGCSHDRGGRDGLDEEGKGERESFNLGMAAGCVVGCGGRNHLRRGSVRCGKSGGTGPKYGLGYGSRSRADANLGAVEGEADGGGEGRLGRLDHLSKPEAREGGGEGGVGMLYGGMVRCVVLCARSPQAVNAEV